VGGAGRTGERVAAATAAVPAGGAAVSGR
jgi:hypothetical protein